MIHTWRQREPPGFIPAKISPAPLHLHLVAQLDQEGVERAAPIPGADPSGSPGALWAVRAFGLPL